MRQRKMYPLVKHPKRLSHAEILLEHWCDWAYWSGVASRKNPLVRKAIKEVLHSG